MQALIQKIIGARWGEKSLIALYLSVLSGLAVAYQYDYRNPYFSAAALDIVLPFGGFLRSLHFYSSQLFFLFSLVHLVAILADTTYRRLSAGRWFMLAATLPAALLLLFTGYLLRGDSTGEAAGAIAENILLAVPYLGELANSLLFSISADGLKRVYANHLIGLGVLWGVFSWDHLRRYRVSWTANGWLLVLLVGFCIAVPAPLEPAVLGTFHIVGPWFFVGLQELLRYMQPFWAGIAFPFVFLAALTILPRYGEGEARLDRRMLALCVLWLLLYTVLTVVGWNR